MADVNPPDALVGLDVGGTMIKGLLLTSAGEILAEETTPTGDDGTTAWRDRAKTVVNSLLKRCLGTSGIGIAAPGLASPDNRCITSLPNRLPGLEQLNWQQWLGATRPVPVFNDAQAALLAEVWRGAAQNVQNVILLTLGTGVGGAAMVDGRVLRGRLGRAGHLGHVSLDPYGPLDIVGTPGSREDAIGEHNVVKRADGRFQSTRDLVKAVEQGSSEAGDIWLKSVRALAAALTGFINVLDPELVVIGGGIADADHSLFDPLQKFLDQFEWRPGGARVRIVKAALGKHAGAIGAAYGALLAHG
jgi:glucokinase